MRVQTLELRAFGCFTGSELDFSAPAHTFHLVYGANEAGKSTALRALDSLLFGIPGQTNDNFLHSYPQLRVAGRLRAASGDERLFVRRKGVKDTLLDEAGRPVPQSVLDTFLAGLTADQYRLLFGLSHAALAEGGRTLLDAGGNVGESLFEAGSAVRGLREALRSLETEYEGLYSLQGKKKPINAALERYGDLRKESKSARLAADTWLSEERDLSKIREEMEVTETQLATLRTRRNRLVRCRDARSPVLRFRAIADELAQLEDAPMLPQDASALRASAVRDLEETVSQLSDAAQKIKTIEEALSSVNVDEPLLAQRESVAALYQRVASQVQNAKELSLRRAEADTSNRRARDLLTAIRSDIALAEADSLRLRRPERDRIRSLTEQGGVIAERLQQTRRSVVKLESDLNAENANLLAIPAAVDVTQLESAVQQAATAGAIEDRLVTEGRIVADLTATVVQALTRLPGWSGELGDCEALPVPLAETVDTFDGRFRDLDHRIEAAEKELSVEGQQVEDLDLRLEVLARSGDVLDEADLAAARNQREHLWERVSRSWLGEGDDTGTEAAHCDPGALRMEYEASVSSADAVSDRLRREAGRVAEKANLLCDRGRHVARVKILRGAVSDLQSERRQLQDEWNQVWMPARMAPRSPVEMRAWLRQHAVLVAESRELRNRERTFQDLEKQAGDLRGALAVACSSLGHAVEGTTSVAALLERGRVILSREEELAITRQRQLMQVDHLQEGLRQARAATKEAEAEETRWRSDWKLAIERVWPGGEIEPSEAVGLLEQLDDLFKALEREADASRKVKGLEDDIREFDALTADLVVSFAPDLQHLPSLFAVSELNERIRIAGEASVRRKTLTAQLDSVREAVTGLEERHRNAERCLEALLAQAAVTTLNDLQRAEEISSRRRELTEQRVQLEQDLVGFAGSGGLDELVTEVSRTDPDQANGEIEELEREIARADETRLRLAQELALLQEDHNRRSGSDAGAVLAEQMQAEIAEIQAHAEQYARARLAAWIARRAIERYRAENQTPVLSRANELFPRLTLNSFAGLRVGYSEKDVPVLRGIRPAGTEVDIEGMSDGSRDQLYLALRLASLEHRFTNSEPFPFVVDDILINFDDERARAALQVLCEFSELTQVVFFTHHARLRELALSVIPRDRLGMHALAG